MALHHTHSSSRWTAVLVAATMVLAALAVPGAAPAAGSATAHRLDPGLPIDGAALQRVIVTGAGALTDLVARHGGRVTSALPLVSGVAAQVPAHRLAGLAAESGVRAVTADRQVRFDNYIYDESTTASNFARTSGATTAWAADRFGAGVGVAVLDTGVSPQEDFAGRLIHGPDLSGEGTTIDSYGHGTVMAGIIAGSGSDSMDRPGGSLSGVAPLAHVVAVKVAGRNGVVDVSTMLQGMHWVSAYRSQYNIRVLNLAWGVTSTQDPSIDPLNYAVQRLWHEGIVVVVAAGNSGPQSATITKPADDPVVLTVGALNDKGDADPTNDAVPGWSSRGPTAAGVTKPDLVAPGRNIISQRSLGSRIEATYPKAVVSPSYIRGSGSSQASAVASGVVALLLEAHPELTPDQVKALLTSTASPVASTDHNIQGAGRIDYTAALERLRTESISTDTVQSMTATGLGSIESSRGGMHVVADCDGVTTEIRGEIDVRCQAWDPHTWTTSDWDGDAWTGVSWKGSEWNGVSWKNVAWSDATWNGVSWKGGTWTSDSWSGLAWTGSGSPDSPWAGVSWKDSVWSGVSWKEGTWTTSDWTTGEYDEFLTAWWGPTPPPGRRLEGEPFTPPGQTRGAGPPGAAPAHPHAVATP